VRSGARGFPALIVAQIAGRAHGTRRLDYRTSGLACCQRPGAATLGLVTRVRALYARFGNLIHEGARFGVVGLIGLVVTDGVTNLLRYQAGLDRLSSFAIASVIATGVTFIGSRYWTYRHRERTGLRRETALFFGVNGIGVAISEVPVGLTYPLHLDSGLSYNIAVNGGIALATLFRYWSYKTWVWRPGATSTTTARPAAAHRQSAGSRWLPRPAGLLDARFRRLDLELAAFSVVGAFAFVVTAAGTILLHFRGGLGPLTSNVIATATATVISYAGNRHWAFRHRKRGTIARDSALFLVLNTGGLAIQLVCLGVSTFVLGLHGKLPFDIAVVTGIALAALFRYWSYRTWVWKAQPSAPQSRRTPYTANGAA
jgi:putative flippase GtrA